MKTLIPFIFTILALALIPDKAESQSRSPIFEQRPRVAPDSRSRPPIRGRRPIQVSRRVIAMQTRGFDYGVNLGTSNSLTDIGGTRHAARPLFIDTQWRTTSINAGMFARYRINGLFAINATFNYGRIGGADSLSGPLSSRYERDFYFTNNIFEFAVTGEVYPPVEFLQDVVKFYGFLGVSVFYHNPNLTTSNPELFEPDRIGKFQPAIPLGIGGHHTFPSNWRIGYEIGWRKTFFDYLDGFTRPASRANDSYFFGQVRVSYFVRQRGARIRF